MSNTELLLPVGNPEMFHAALEGGADAVYLGLRQFNARGRASNFTIQQLQALLKLARKKGVKVYLTLNTVIKNEELSALLDTLYMMDQTTIDALIIQDWGVFHLLRNHFPKLEIHASTQMANHNSLGAIFSQQTGFKRVVMARELTLPELTTIRQKSDIPLEIFMHGALCYSLSGMCLFSSFLGGSGANRGLCTQPCRRLFDAGKESKYLFSLKDNQAIDVLPQLSDMGIASIKVEGRLKPAEYVYRVAKAYRMVLDNPREMDKAKEILRYDMGREKTGYFLAGSVKGAITQHPNTGVLIGTVIRVTPQGFEIRSNHPLEIGNRLRIRPANGEIRKAFKLKIFKGTAAQQYWIEHPKVDPSKGDQVFLAGLQQEKFSNKFRDEGRPVRAQMPYKQKQHILSRLESKNKPAKEQVYMRVDSLAWMRKIRMEDLDGLILNLSQKEWQELRADSPFLQKQAHKIIIELPQFIQEKQLPFYKNLCETLHKKGFKNFMLSHLSQKLIVPANSKVATNENVYIFNDAATALLRKQKVNLYTYPLENDMENLLAGHDRFGIVPLYFYPHLFTSRMPIDLPPQADNQFMDDMQGEHQRVVRDGLTLIIPKNPVSLLQYKQKLNEAGFRRFLIDMSHHKPSSNTFKRVLKRFQQSEQIQPSSNFNFKKGVK